MKQHLQAAATLSLAGCAALAQAADEIPPICTDRPTKSNYACVVEPGRWQYEADIVNASRLDLDGVRTDTVTAVNPTLKYGLVRHVDIELNWSPSVSVRTRDASGASTTLRGVGDTTVRAKWGFLDSGAWSATLLPYVKLPTARRGIGNRAVEGGLLVPINYKLSEKVTLATVPEFDALKDSNGNGRHLGTSQLVNVGWSLPHDVTLYAEVWGNWNFDRPSTVRQSSADFAATWLLDPTLQLDAGTNLGLNRATPAVQVYFGLSQKF